MRYPDLPLLFNLNDKQLRDMYNTVDKTPSNNIYTVVTVTEIGIPRKGDIAYSASSGKFKGYVSLGTETSWQNLN